MRLLYGCLSGESRRTLCSEDLGARTAVVMQNTNEECSLILAKYFSDAVRRAASGDREKIRRAPALGAGQYIKKPYTLENPGLAVKREPDR